MAVDCLTTADVLRVGMPRGGARVGAGRKPKSTSGTELLARALPVVISGLPALPAESLQEVLAQAQGALLKTIVERQGELVEAMMRLATGQVSVEKVDEDGNEFIYRLAPDRQALEFLITMAHGKPTQKQTVQADTTINVIHHMSRPDPVKVARKAEQAEAEEEAAIEAVFEIEPVVLPVNVDMPEEEADPWTKSLTPLNTT